MKRPLALLLLSSSLLGGCALIQRMLPQAKEPAYRPESLSDAAVRLPGVETMVGAVALKDLLEWDRQDAEELGAGPTDGGAPESDGGAAESRSAFMTRCLSNPSAYEVWVDLAPDQHRSKVIVFPVAECSMKFFGGAAEYVIDSTTLEILHRERME